MDPESIATIIFLVLISLFLVIKRKKLHIQKLLFPIFYFAMYRTKLGLKTMDKYSKKFKKPLKYLSYFGIFIGFIGMLFLTYSLTKNVYDIITKPTALPGVMPVLPIKARGIFYVPFFYFIISIFTLAVVHEFAHGIVARLHNIKLKSSGFAFLGVLIPIIPLAFVEPDEKKVKKLPASKQLSIFAAGPFSNIIFAFIALLILSFVFVPAIAKIMEPTGVEIINIVEDSPAELAGIEKGEIITHVDDKEIIYLQNLSKILDEQKPGEKITLITDKATYDIALAENPDNKTKSYIGLYMQQNTEIKQSIKEKYSFLPNIILWFAGLFLWLYLLNLGVGLFNLIPVGPIDGGRMLFAVLGKYIKKNKAIKIFKIISILFIAIVLVNFLAAFIK